MKELDRFVKAQEMPYVGYKQALFEIKAGHKQSHWIWYVFPQIHGMGQSWASKEYAIQSPDEAKAYLGHDVLGPRLREITRELLNHRGESVGVLMGSGIDVRKLRSCMTLFDIVSPNDVFSEVLEVFFDGERDDRTLKIVSAEEESAE